MLNKRRLLLHERVGAARWNRYIPRASTTACEQAERTLFIIAFAPINMLGRILARKQPGKANQVPHSAKADKQNGKLFTKNFSEARIVQAP